MTTHERMCLRCGNVPSSGPDRPYCVQCLYKTRTEIEVGMREMDDWLRNDPHAQKLAAWAEYDREHQPHT